MALDEAVSRLGLHASETSALRPLEADELLVVFVQLPAGWVVLHQFGDGVECEQLGSQLGSLDDDVALARALLDPISARIRKASRISIVAPPVLRHVDFHALPFGGGVLVDTLPVTYSLDLPPRRRASGGTGTFILADTRGDLPHARLEGEAIARKYEQAEVSIGPAASRQRVLSAIAGARIFHYSGHAEVMGPGGWQSGLPVAQDQTLEVGDILSAASVPEEIVLSGCETGRSGTDGRGEGIGIAQAFVVAGTSRAVSATRKVRDDEALALLTAYHEAHASTPEARLRGAQMHMRKQWPRSDWAAFRVITD